MDKKKITEFVEFLAKELVAEKDKVKAEFKEDDTAFVLNVMVAEDEIGKVIGKEGRTANAIRTIVKSFSGRLDKKLIIKFNS